ncbi:hypothetical protein PoB_000412000 [Plakobranchus ocellatus]|uniref:Uncharacterized protein n=1 Tax=Plakobranchus ocellatus TaxID=259542 RepID=A0AAV3Y3K5_9GAST|nr:hypothetical protein PoB_000412000 [Plakobranchus ocellatus]
MTSRVASSVGLRLAVTATSVLQVGHDKSRRLQRGPTLSSNCDISPSRKRSRGRQREKIMDGLATWLGPGKVSDILAAVKNRDLWRDMIANAYITNKALDDDDSRSPLWGGTFLLL